MSRVMLEVKDLTTKYITRFQEDVYAVDGVSLTVEDGKSLGIHLVKIIVMKMHLVLLQFLHCALYTLSGQLPETMIIYHPWHHNCQVDLTLQRQRTGCYIRFVIKLLQQLLYPFTGGIRDLAPFMDHPVHSSYGNIGYFSNILDSDSGHFSIAARQN